MFVQNFSWKVKVSNGSMKKRDCDIVRASNGYKKDGKVLMMKLEVVQLRFFPVLEFPWKIALKK